MFGQIATFLIDTVVTFFVLLLLARFHFQWLRVSFHNPIGQFVLATIDAQAGPGDALEAVDHGPAFVILQADGECGLAALVAEAEVFHVTLVLQHARDGRLDLG